jgi:uncharacterized protein (DUF2267 family)
MCELCQALVQTNREFVEHVKRLHRDETDQSALQMMESLLESNDNLITVD